MKLKFVSSIAVAVLMSVAAFSQASNSSAALPSAPGTADPAAAAPALNPNAVKVAAINVERAIMLSNEGQRDMNALQKKFEPKLADLKAKGDELEALNKQAAAAGITPEKKDDINRQIEQKKKVFDREQQDVRDDAQGQQGEVGQRILQKMAPVIVKYAQENGFGMIIDTSAPWPQGPVLWASPASLDITEAVVTAYNVQSGVPAQTAPAAKPSSGATKPATKPATTTPPAK